MSNEKNHDANRLRAARAKKPQPRNGNARRAPSRLTARPAARLGAPINRVASRRSGRCSSTPSGLERSTNAFRSDVRKSACQRTKPKKAASRASPEEIIRCLEGDEIGKMKTVKELEGGWCGAFARAKAKREDRLSEQMYTVARLA